MEMFHKIWLNSAYVALKEISWLILLTDWKETFSCWIKNDFYKQILRLNPEVS